MHCSLVAWGRRLVCAGWLVVISSAPTGAEERLQPPTFESTSWAWLPTDVDQDWIVRGQEGPVQPVDIYGGPRQPLDVSRPSLSGQVALAVLAAEERSASVNAVSASQVKSLGVSDVGAMLQESSAVQTTNVRRRSPVALDPYVRGYTMGQIYSVSNGVNWCAVRPDLDSILNKTDPSLVEQMVVIPGPYGLRYGPGFAFIDVLTTRTPRYEAGTEYHNRMNWTYRSNGGQIYGTDTVYGGAERYGYAVTYGKRTGADYEAGNGLRIPSSYNIGNLLGQVGFDFGDDNRLEFRYQHVDESDTEYAGQVFDVDAMTTNGYSLAYVKGAAGDRVRVEAHGWYNHTGFSGNTLKSGKWRESNDYPVLRRIDSALKGQGFGAIPSDLYGSSFQGFANGDSTSTGARAALIWGQEEEIQFRVGADVRVMDQLLTEKYTFAAPPDSHFNLPRATLVDPGLYSETTLLWTTYWTMTAGGRVDFAHTTAKSPTAEYPQTLGTALDQGDMLYAGYLTNALDLSSNWTTHVGVGYSEITPDLFQRYANGVLLGVIQSGFSRIFGKPSLPKERLLQVDWDVEAKFDRLRGRAGVFYGWLYDYATYEANVITEPSGARLLYATSTDRAALHGFELYGEYDVCPRVTPFGSMRYVRGEDCVISQPLPQIPPLEATVGLRLEDTEAVRPWGLEYGVRMVAGQDRIAFLRRRVITGVEPLEYPTSGFTTAYVRGYITPTPNLHIIGGIDNLFDRSYVEHLNLRLAPQGPNVATPVLSPGITPYLAVEWRL